MTTQARINLSPSPDRVGRACAWIERQDGFVLMTEARAGWTLPGGGIEPRETPQAAAVREAWEEVGAHCEVTGEGWVLDDGSASVCVPMRLLGQEDSPEGRRFIWVNPRALPWAADVQLRQILSLHGLTPEHLALPPLVSRARSLADTLGFHRCCSEETGRLLRTLAAGRPGGRLLELGTGVGVGAAWMLSGMNETAHLLTVENDETRANTAWELLRGEARVTTLYGDWQDTLEHGPFDLIFNDCAPAKREMAHLNRLVNALNPGGMLVMDHFSPPAYLPESLYAGDNERDSLFRHPQLHCTELQVSRLERVILATRTV